VGFLLVDKIIKNNKVGACSMQKYATIKAQASYGLGSRAKSDTQTGARAITRAEVVI
jgi:hypothetical protein